MADHSHDQASLTVPADRIALQGIYDAAAVEVYKSDRRSRVWRAVHGEQSYVVKRYEYSRLRQYAARWFGLHPAQREVRAARRLYRLGIAVVPIVGLSTDRGRVYTITRYKGTTLVRLAREESKISGVREMELSKRVGSVIAKLVVHGVFFRDLKTSNVLVDTGGTPWLIDTGSARRSWRVEDAARMIAMLEHTTERDGVSVRERLRCLRVAVHESKRLGGFRSMVDRVGPIAARM